jgi:3-hydroxyisobutyrate dehydrogenase-like beta-hydroxyacid dehydrogenase
MHEQTVGVIGLGIMGRAVSGNLVQAGFRVIGHDLLPERVRALAANGGQGAASARAVAEAAPVVITLLPGVPALEQVVSGERGLVAAKRADLVLLECSTLPIAAKEAAERALGAVGAQVLDCPLSGTGAQAITRDLVVYASGDQEVFERCREVFGGFARSSRYTGPFGNGSRFKFVANLLVSIHNVAAAEAFVLGIKAGLAPDLLYELIGNGAGTSRMFEVRGPMMVEGRYEPATMTVQMWQKDLAIISEFGRALGAPTPLFAASAELYAAALAEGRAQQDTASVCAVLEAIAGLAPRQPGSGGPPPLDQARSPSGPASTTT